MTSATGKIFGELVTRFHPPDELSRAAPVSCLDTSQRILRLLIREYLNRHQSGGRNPAPDQKLWSNDMLDATFQEKVDENLRLIRAKGTGLKGGKFQLCADRLHIVE